MCLGRSSTAKEIQGNKIKLVNVLAKAKYLKKTIFPKKLLNLKVGQSGKIKKKYCYIIMNTVKRSGKTQKGNIVCPCSLQKLKNIFLGCITIIYK